MRTTLIKSFATLFALLVFLTFGGVARAAPSCVGTFYYTGGAQTCTVPWTVSSIRVQLLGAGGGGGSSGLGPVYDGELSAGGRGGYTTGYVAVTPGQTLTVMVGQGGACGRNTPSYGGGGATNATSGSTTFVLGASGGGRSAIFNDSSTVLANELMTAGGGGGSVCHGQAGRGGHGGGDYGFPGLALNIPASYGAGLGGTQYSGGATTFDPLYSLVPGLTLASSGVRGSGGVPGVLVPVSGSLAGYTIVRGGGGGGGYYGGAGGETKGAMGPLGGGGGGGSGYCGGTGVTGCASYVYWGGVGTPYTAPAGTPADNGTVIIEAAAPAAETVTAPTISGPTTGATGSYYTYTFSDSVDSANNDIRYEVDWNNDSIVDEWAAPWLVSSGATASSDHPWSVAGVNVFKARAVSVTGIVSAWTTYSVTVSALTPTVLLTVSASTFTPGDPPIILSWSSSNSTSCAGTNMNTFGATAGNVTSVPTMDTTYRVTCAGPGGSASDSKTVTFVAGCVPTNLCSGSNVVNSCTGVTVQACAPGVCTSGACVAPGAVSVVGDLTATPARVRPNATTRLQWNVANAASCSVVGSNGDSWNLTQSSGSGEVSSPIVRITTYTLNCTGFDSSTVTQSTTVRLIPLIIEQ